MAPIFGDQITEMSVKLARHFEMAKIYDKAVGFRLQAGNYAIKLAANDQAIDHFSKGLALLEKLPESTEKTRQELALQLGLGTGYQLMEGYASPEAHRAYSRARNLGRRVGDSPELVAALWPLATRAAMVGDLSQGVTLAEEALDVAKRVKNPLFIAVAHHHLGWILHQVGRFVESCYHQDEIISFYDRQYHEEMVHMFGHDFGVTSLGWSSWPLWYLGYPDKALQRGQEAIALAQSFDHPFSLMHAYNMTGLIHVLRGDLIKAGEFGERIMDLATSYGFHFYTAPANYYLGAGLIGHGRIAEGIAYQRKSMAIYEAGGVKMLRGTYVGIANIYASLGQYELGRKALSEAEAMEFEDYCVCTIEHVRGMLLQLQGDANEKAEACFVQAIELARRQQAKSSELQATMSLCRLWQEQGRQMEAWEKLSSVYNWFTEGFETADLKAAAALLEELA
jgi:tetratricopeptide (TPR) repeat protein